jgi:ectoine hydroxylase-related dioxygenase (phytanoyl-CoA dioxygenase family)
MDNYEFDKYIATKNNLKEIINKYGIAIIPNVLNEDECNNMISGMWDFLEHVSQKWELPINRNNKNTWSQIKNLYNINSSINMLIQFWRIGQCQMSWDIRQNPKVVEIFSTFYNVKNEDLLVSFDGVSFQMPPEITNFGWFDEVGYWYHTDQSYTTPEFRHLQSWITGTDVNIGDGTLSFLEGSHKYHKEFRDLFNIKSRSDWYLLKNNEKLFYLDKCIEKKVKCPKGSLVVWDSRLIHCGTQPLKNREKDNIRCVSYLCYGPRSESNKENLEIKKQTFINMESTTHNPCIISKFPTNPYEMDNNFDYNELITDIKRPKLNDLGLKLAGF